LKREPSPAIGIMICSERIVINQPLTMHPILRGERSRMQ
jgi:hypothetical protein